MNENYIIPKSHDEWIDLRNKCLGGTDISAVIGLNPYRTKLDVFLEKTGRAQELDPDTPAFLMGHALEPAIVDLFAKKTGAIIELESEGDIHYSHSVFDFLGGSPDRLYTDLDGIQCVLECKSTSKNIDINTMPLYWYCQLQWYLGLTDREHGAIAWISGNYGLKFDYLEFDFDEDFYTKMVNEGKNFWFSYIMTDIAPEPETEADVIKLYPERQKRKSVELIEDGERIFKLHQELASLKIRKKKIDDQISEIEDQIKSKFLDGEILTLNGETRSTYIESKFNRVDSAKLKKEYPDVYNAVIKTSTVRRFTNKVSPV